MEELIRTFIDSQRKFFNEIDGRLKQFDGEQRSNKFAAFIFSIWNDCYIEGIRELLKFESICSHLLAGNIDVAKRFMEIPSQAKLTTSKENEARILYTILLNERNPTRTFQDACKAKNRQIIASLISLTNQMPQATEDLELIACWIATFPHSDPSNIIKKTDGSSIFGSVLKIVIGGIAGYSAAKAIHG